MNTQFVLRSGLKDRLRAGGIHLGLSIGVAALAALLVFGVWYPNPYREISGGRELFTILVSVDVIMGPLITLVIFNRRKSWVELRRDLAVVALLQCSALAYGLWTVSVARPVHLVFEYNRFTVVHAVDLTPDAAGEASPGVAVAPWTGPTLLGLRPFKDNHEKSEATLAAFNSRPLPTRTDLWQPYEASRQAVLAEAKPVALLQARFPARAAAIAESVRSGGGDPQTALYLPLMSRRAIWTVLLDPTNARILGAFPLDPY